LEGEERGGTGEAGQKSLVDSSLAQVQSDVSAERALTYMHTCEINMRRLGGKHVTVCDANLQHANEGLAASASE
jgi:hypothetical protein